MDTQKIGIREFRENLATYVLESTAPVAITRHGDTVGYYLPAGRRRTEAEKAAFEDAAEKWQKMLDEKGITEDEVIADFKAWRAQQAR